MGKLKARGNKSKNYERARNEHLAKEAMLFMSTEMKSFTQNIMTAAREIEENK